MTIHFFGDSWSDEFSELEWLYYTKVLKINVPADQPQYKDATKILDCSSYDFPESLPESYPKMISKMLNVPFKNYSQSGTSILSMLDKLIYADVKPRDHAVFSLTSTARTFFLDDKNKRVNRFASCDVEEINDYQFNWTAGLACFSIYNYCVSNNVTPWFLSTFNAPCYKDFQYHKVWDYIPDENWIIDKHSCVIQKLFDPDFFSEENGRAVFRNSDWTEWLESNNQAVREFIRPCYDHPNTNGRIKIAECIANKLKQK